MKRLLVLCLMALFVSISYSQIPKVLLKNIDGVSVSTDTLSNGDKPFAIMFFASWCKPCNRELDNISEVYEEWVEETGFKIYAVSIDEGQNIQKVKPLVNSHCWSFDILLDSNSDFRRSLGINMIPHTLVFSGAGLLVYSRSGYQDGSENTLYEIIKDNSK